MDGGVSWRAATAGAGSRPVVARATRPQGKQREQCLELNRAVSLPDVEGFGEAARSKYKRRHSYLPPLAGRRRALYPPLCTNIGWWHVSILCEADVKATHCVRVGSDLCLCTSAFISRTMSRLCRAGRPGPPPPPGLVCVPSLLTTHMHDNTDFSPFL